MDKKRCNNFTSNEIDVLVSLVEEAKDIVEYKKTDTVANNRKELEWRKLEGKFNSVCATARTAKMLRNKWDSLKKGTKKEYAEHKQSLYRTGGGPGVSGILGTISLRILAIVGIGVTGSSSQFDSDFDLFNSEGELPNDNWSNSAHTQGTIIPEEIEDRGITTDKDGFEESEKKSLGNWTKWNPQQLRQPKSKALEVSEPNSGDFNSDLGLEACDELETETAGKTSSKFETPNSCNDIKKRKRFHKVEPISSKLKNSRVSSEQLHEELLKKKIGLIDLQTEVLKEEREQKKALINVQVGILREEADQKKLQQAEKHMIEMQILLAEFKIKENQLG